MTPEDERKVYDALEARHADRQALILAMELLLQQMRDDWQAVEADMAKMRAANRAALALFNDDEGV